MIVHVIARSPSLHQILLVCDVVSGIVSSALSCSGFLQVGLTLAKATVPAPLSLALSRPRPETHTFSQSFSK